MPQTGTDIVGAGYPISRPLLSLLGGATNTYQGNVPVKTNMDYTLGSVVDSAQTTTGVSLSVPVPVSPGDVITKATYIMGATAASPFTTGTADYAFSALYSGFGSAPALIGSSTVITGSTPWVGTATVASSMAAVVFTYASPVTITSVTAPYGFIYADVNMSLSTLPSLAGVTTTASVWSFPWFANGPRWMVTTHDTAAGSTPPNPMGAVSYVAKAPIVFLS